MNQNAFGEHTLWATVDSLKEMLGGDLAGEVEEHRDEIRLIHSAVQFIDSLRETDPGLVDVEVLTSINSDLTQGREHLNNYIADRESNAALLTSSVVTSIASARNSAIRTMPAPLVDGAGRAAKEATERYRDAADAEIATLRGEIEGLKARVGELDEQRTADIETAQQSLSELQQKIAEGGPAGRNADHSVAGAD